MTQMNTQLITNAYGRLLTKVTASVYMANSELALRPIRISLCFESIHCITFAGASDGWHIRIDETHLEPVDMEDAGELIVRDISRTSVFRHYLHKLLENAWIVESPTKGHEIGVRFSFGGPRKPMILNWGDGLWIADDYPKDKDETINETPIVC